MEGQYIDKPRRTRVVCLFVLLLLLVFGWAVLIFRVPILFNGFSPGFLLDRNSGIATLTHVNRDLKNPWAEEIKFDMRSGALDWKMSREVDDLFLTAAGIDRRQYRRQDRNLILQLRGDGQYQFLAHPSSGLPDRKFEFPYYPSLVNGRFALGEEAGNLLILDCGDEGSVVKKTPVGGVQLGGGLQCIDNVDGFLRFQTMPVVGKNPPSYQVQHFTINKNGTAIPGLVWQALDLTGRPFYCVGGAGDERASINPTTFEVEFRLANNGKLVDSIPLLSGMNPVTMPCYLYSNNYLQIDTMPSKRRYLDLKRRKWVPLIKGLSYSPSRELEDKFILLYSQGDDRKCLVFDIQKQEVISEFNPNWFTDFVDEESILDVSSASGLTFNKIDLRTGDVIQSWKPFWWVVPAMSLLCASWLVWSWLWLATKSGDKRNANVVIWLDVGLVTLLPLLFCIMRLRFIGNTSDLSRMPVEIAHSVVISLLLGGVVWLVHTRMRIVPRLLPLLLAITVLVTSVTITFKGQFAYVVPGVIQALIPITAFLVCCLVFRGIGYRLTAPGEIDSPSAIEKTSLVTMRDMFVLVAVVAMMFAGLSPWLPDIGDPLVALSQALFAIWLFVLVSFAPVLAWWLAMSQKKWRYLGDVLFLGTFAFLIASSAYQFSGNSSLVYDWFGFFPQIGELPAKAFVATYWVACCFRFRGWEFSRRKGVQKLS